MISSICVQPKTPRWLADPTALEASHDDPIYVTTRDGACFYDQLVVPSALVEAFGRLQVRASDLLSIGLDSSALQGYVIDAVGPRIGQGDLLTPVSLTCPMGFAHSAHIAEHVMTASCLAARFAKR